MTKLRPKFKLISKVRKISFSFILILFTVQFSHAQISITSSDMAVPNHQIPVSRNQQPNQFITGFQTSGQNVTWDFSGITATNQQIANLISPTSSDIQFLCIAVFNSPFDPEHNATVARNSEIMAPPFGGIEISNVYEFFKKTDSTFSMVGRSASINSAPTCIRSNPVDLLYRFPLQYGDTIESYSEFEIDIPTFGYYGQQLTRKNIADAWGVVITPLGSYNALRIKSELQISDSIYYDSGGFGIRFPHTETHYIWLTNDMIIPVFTVEERGLTFGGTIASWADTLINSDIFEIQNAGVSLFPNPVSGDQLYINVTDRFSGRKECIVYDIMGRKQMSVQVVHGLNEIQVSSLAAGVYYIRTEGTDNLLKFIVY